MIEVSLQHIFTGHAEPIYCLAIDESNNYIYSGSGDGFVGQWSIKEKKFLSPVAKVESTVYSLCYQPKDKILYVGLQDGVLNIIDIKSKTLLKSLKLFNSGIFDIAVQNNNLLLASGDGNLGVVDGKTFELKDTIHLSKKSLRCVQVSPDGQHIIVGASDHKVYFLENVDGWQVKQEISGHKNSVFSATYKDDFTLLTASRDALLKEWDWQYETKEWILKQSIPAHNYTINKVVLSPSNHLVATSSRDKTIKIWDVKTLALLKVINLEKFPDGHSHSINTLLWLDNTTLLSAGDDKKIVAWRIELF